jgi:hypothetical protein
VSFTNVSGGGTFYLSTVSFSGLDSSSSGCAGDTLTLNAYGDTIATPLALATFGGSSVTNATVGITTGAVTSAAGTVTSAPTGIGTATTSFDLGFSTPQSTSGAVYKLTLQSAKS